MKINRFPKMAALQKFRALKLGFDLPTAEAIGIAEATKYAIFKNLSLKTSLIKSVLPKKKKRLLNSIRAKRSLRKRLLPYLNCLRLTVCLMWEVRFIQARITKDIL